MIAFLSFQTSQLNKGFRPLPTPTIYIENPIIENTPAVKITSTPTPTNTITPTPTPVATKDLSATEVTKRMGNGINLGHVMDAYGRKSLGTTASVIEYETAWGQPITTKEMIEGIKKAGFDTIRIPVSWTNTMNYEIGDYTINSAYLDRVEELIDYALQSELFVIVNDHWDGGWWGMFGSSSPEVRASAMELYTSMWKQIATRYADKSHYLVFESANEELGYRLNNTDVCGDSGSLSEEDYYLASNQINQAFVNTVRSCGGNNQDRFLLIAGINANIGSTCNKAFQMPTDSSNEKLLVSVHYYDPYNYCLFPNATSWGSEEELSYMEYTLSKLNSFKKAGIGVVISEWGIVTEPGVQKENQQFYMKTLLELCEKYDYCPILWDTGYYYDKTTCEVKEEFQTLFFRESE